MATDVVRSNMASAVTGQGFQMACLTLPTHFLQFFLQSRVPPAPTVVEAKAAEVYLAETEKDPVEGVVADE